MDVVDLRKHGIRYRQVAGLIDVKDKKWIIPAKRQEIYNRLRKDLNLKAVVVVTETRILAMVNCGSAGCFYFYSLGHGIFSKSTPFWFKFYSAAAYKSNIYILDTPSNSGLGADYRELKKDRAKHMRGFPDPKDIKNFPPAEWGPVRGHIEAYIDRMAAKIASTLGKS